MKIAVIGTGYVGLVTGACLSDFGHNVVCIDIDEKKIENLKKGIIPIFEPGLDDLVKKNYGKKTLNFSTDISDVEDAEAVFIAVGTPTSRRGDGYANMEYVYVAAKQIAENLGNHHTVIIDKSTVPVGTGDQVKEIMSSANPDADFSVVSNPEFLREGEAVDDFMKPDRVVIGTDSDEAVAIMKNVYGVLYTNGTHFVFTDIRSAEACKYASNAFLAVKITYANEIANVCEEIGANATDVLKAMGMDKRIGDKFLHPGPGYGGSCFPKDTVALLSIAQEYGVPLRIVEATSEANKAQKARMIMKIRKALGGSERSKVIAVLGLTFKPKTDDMRDSASLTIIPELINKGAVIRTYDPEGMGECKKILPGSDFLQYVDDSYDTCDGADAVVLMTEWNEFRALDFDRIKELMNTDDPVFVDLRNVYDPELVKAHGFRYVGVGRS
ncbi:UDP-glucose dehydrogenase family protein [Patescibacteria group bacterium]